VAAGGDLAALPTVAAKEKLVDDGARATEISSRVDLNSVRRAWRALLEDRGGIPGGMTPLLRAAEISLGPERTIELTVPPGSPLLERLATRQARRPLEEAMSQRLGVAVSLNLQAREATAEDGNRGRITPEGARREQLRRLAREEPLLQAAVQELDLELLD
jgi:hypothetical protein